MSTKRKLITYILLFIALLFFSILIYLVGNTKHILIPHAEELGRVNNFVFSYEGMNNCNLVVVVKKGLISKNDSNYGKVSIVSSSGQEKCYELSHSSMVKCNWISSMDNKTEEAYILFRDNKFSESVKNGDIILVKISSENLKGGNVWIHCLRPYKNNSHLKFINLIEPSF